MTTDRTVGTVRRPRARRRHAAPGGRILAGSLSAAAALGLMGAMAHEAPTTVTSTTAATETPATPTVVLVRRPAGATVAAPVSPRVTPTAAAPVASSQGS